MPAPFQRIITAVDFAPPSLQAIGYGIALALRFKAAFYLFHSLFAAQDPLHDTDIRRRPQGIARQTAQTRAKMADLMATAPIPWEPLICAGPPVETVAAEARRLQADLVIAAGHGLSVIQKLFLGRVVDPMVRALACPLLIIRNKSPLPLDLTQPAGFKKIVIACALEPTLATPSADPVATLGMRLARAFGAELHLLHALEIPLDASAVNPTAAPYSEVQQRLQDQRVAALQGLVSPSLGNVCPIHTISRPGPPAEVLASYCREVEPDLIVVGVRRRGLVKKLMVGSTTEALLHQRKANLLTVPLEGQPSSPEAGARAGAP